MVTYKTTDRAPQDMVLLDSTVIALGAGLSYTGEFFNVDTFGKLVGSILSDHETIGTVTFTGVGLNDLSAGGAYTGKPTRNYRVEIDAAAVPDTFRWSNDGGVTWESTGVAITGGAQTLEDGITITFGLTTGHTLNEYWDFTVTREDGTLYVEQSQNGTDVLHRTTLISYADDPENGGFVIDVTLPYARIRYVVGGFDQTSLSIYLYKRVL